MMFAIILSALITLRILLAENPKDKILRVATKRDQEVFSQYEEQKKECLEACRHEIKETKLEMKLIDARISLDGKQIVFAFTADGRIDFR